MRGTGRRASTHAASVLALLLLVACAGTDPETCSTEHLATLRTVPALGFLAVPVMIGDEQATMLLDTGAQDSMLAADWTQSRNLEPDRHHVTNLLGTGGGGRRVDNVLVPQLGIGNLRTGELSLPVGKLPGTLSGVEPPLAGLLGLDTLAPYELDIDRPAGTVGLYVRSGCDGEGPPWPGPATKVDLLTANNNLLMMPVGIDGTTLLAIVDTGARRTLLSAGAARRIGLADAATSDDPIVSTEGVDLRPSRTRLHRFNDVRIGDHVFHDVRLAISDADLPIGDMLLGEDFFRTRRFWLSPSTATAFIGPGQRTASAPAGPAPGP